MIKQKIEVAIMFITVMGTCHLSWGYDGNVHSNINEKAVSYSQLNSVLRNQLGIENGIDEVIEKGKVKISILKWIAFGGKTEDYGKFGYGGLLDMLSTRAYSYFLDPLKDREEAGLDNLINNLYFNNYGEEPVSSILWGLNPGGQVQDPPPVYPFASIV
jgi:hypothetical protein